MSEKLKIPSASVLSWVIIIILVLSSILLIRQNLQLRTTVEKLVAEQKIQIGEKFTAFNAVDLEDRPIEVNFNESKAKTILLFSSTTCPFCKKQNPYWNDVIKQIDYRKYQILEVFHEKEDKGKVIEYLKNNSLENEKSSLRILFLADEFLRKNKLNSTPITLIIGENGIVERAWFGLWSKSTITEVNSSLEISIQPKS